MNTNMMPTAILPACATCPEPCPQPRASRERRAPRSLAPLVALLVRRLCAFAGSWRWASGRSSAWPGRRPDRARDARCRRARARAGPALAALERRPTIPPRARARPLRHERETCVAATTELGAGYWVLTPLRTDQGFWVLVNRGFVPAELRDRPARTPPRRAAGGRPAAPQRAGGGLLRSNDPPPAAGIRATWPPSPPRAAWPARSRPTSSTRSAAGAPRRLAAAGLTVLHFSNNHRVYAATWFALAAMLACGHRLPRRRRAAPAADAARRSRLCCPHAPIRD
jgi:surfeit locus 1 family protein